MLRTILWATDGSANADRALSIAKDLAGTKGGKLIVAHCRELLTGRAAGLPANANEDELLAKIRAQAAELESDGFDVHLEVVTTSGTNAPRAITDIARTEGADVIVLGTRGHSPLRSVLAGSVTQRLLHTAPCPVLAVPAEKHVESVDPALITTGAAHW